MNSRADGGDPSGDADAMPQAWRDWLGTRHELPALPGGSVLAWTDALTLVAQTQAPDDDFEELRSRFTDEEIVKLTLLIGAINVWNRLAIGFRSQHPVSSASTVV